MYGCATTQDRELAMTAKPPDVCLGPVYELLKVKTSRDRVHVVLDRSGLGHVIVALTERKEIHHVVVGPEGVLEREIIRTCVSPWTIDAAFDATGLLHVLIDDEHLVKKDGLWRNLDRTPWKEACFEAAAPRFVPGAPDLIWAFPVEGTKVGSPKRWDLIGFGSFIFAMILPIYTSGSKLVVVSEADSNFTSWAVLDPHDALSIRTGFKTSSL
jgi:hypothetical protein